MVGLAELYLPPFAIFLGASDLSLGLIVTLPQLAGSISQLTTVRLQDRFHSRKKFILRAVLLQIGCLFLMTSTPAIPKHPLWFLGAACMLYWVAAMIANPAWQSWLGDMVPAHQRGRYFGRRNGLIQIVTFLALVGGGMILEASRQDKLKGFILLFGLAIAARFVSLSFLQLHSDFPISPEKEKPLSFLQFTRKMHRHNFGLFVLYTALFAAALNISAPYFAQYMLDGLKFSYLQFMTILAMMIGCKFLTLPLWGRLSDRYGTRKLLVVSGLLFCLPPFLWMISTNYYYLLAIQLVAGAGFAGFELCSFNFILDSTGAHERTRSAAYYQVLTGIGIVTGSVIGGLILWLAPAGGHPFLLLFLVSGSARLVLSFAFLPRIREVRDVPSISYWRLLMEMTGYHVPIE